MSSFAPYAGSDQEGANHCTISGTLGETHEILIHKVIFILYPCFYNAMVMEVDKTPSSSTLMTSVVVIPEGDERDTVRCSQLTTPINPASNITSNNQTHLVTLVHFDVQAVDEAFVMANYSRLEPLLRKRMRELRLQGVTTRLGYSSEDVD
ncbi:hypothetical protein Tco_1331336 [Tanacetum coccineum]